MAVKDVVAEKMLEDKETRMTLLSSGTTAIKYIALTLVGVGVIYGGYKLTKYIVNKNKSDSEVDAQTAGMDKNNVHIPDSQLVNMANSLYTAFNTDATWKWSANIDEDSIRRTLSLLSNVDEWKALQKTFGSRDGGCYDSGQMHNLVWFLQQDDDKDRQSYQAILDKIGMPNALGSLNGKKRKKKKGFLKKLLNPATPFKAIAKGTKAVNKAVKKKGVKALLNPGTGFKIVQKSIK
ncbi:MAG: hypothetical protein II956_14495 [Bacteroidales bacterium]|nr:hypothetical protein [Bacteroidales bacterium]